MTRSNNTSIPPQRKQRRPAHKNETLHYHQLTPRQKRNSIGAQIINTEAAIKHLVNNSNNKQTTRDALVAQMERSLDRVRKICV